MKPRIEPEMPIIDRDVVYTVYGQNPEAPSPGDILWAGDQWVYADNESSMLRAGTVQFIASKLLQLNRASGVGG